MTIVRSLLSWIVYALCGAFLKEQIAASAAAAVAVVVLAQALRRGRRGNELVIESASAAFFLGYALIAWLTGGSTDVTRWVGAVSQLWLAGAVGIGLLRDRPFTEPIAEREAPTQVHHTPWFHAFNITLTRAWLASFTVSGVVLLVAAAAHRSATWLSVVCIVLAILAPTLFTRRLVARMGEDAAG